MSARGIVEARSPVLYHGGERFNDFDDRSPEYRVRHRPDGWAVQVRYSPDDDIWHWVGQAKATEQEAEASIPEHKFPGTIYATDDIEAASSYAGQFPADQAEIKTLRMRFRNPLDLRDPEAFKKWTGHDMSGEADPSRTMAHSNFQLRTGGKLLQKIKDAGHDGVIFYDTDNLNRGVHTSHVAFSRGSVRPARNPQSSKTWWDYPIRDRWGRATSSKVR